MSTAIEKLLERAVLMMERLERVLPQALSEPDWSQAIAWRYRKRASGHGVLEGVRHVSDMNLNDLQEIDGQKEKLQQNTFSSACLLPPFSCTESRSFTVSLGSPRSKPSPRFFTQAW